MVGAVLAAAPYVLNALGGIFGRKHKYMDAAEVERRFGAQAVSDRAQKLYQMIHSSPYGQALLAQAAQAGQEFNTQTQRNAAASGLSPETGATSGASMFATSAGASAASNLENQTNAGIYGNDALPEAQRELQNEMIAAEQARAEQNAQPTTFQKIAAAAGQVAGGLTAAGVGAPKAAPKPAAVVTPGATAPQPEGVQQFQVQQPNTTMPLAPGTGSLAYPKLGQDQFGQPTIAPFKKMTMGGPRAARSGRGWMGFLSGGK